MQNTPQFDLTALADNWPSPLVPRTQAALDAFAGQGFLNARSLANADSLGTGPKNRVKVGRKIAYPAMSLIAWMQAKREV